MKNKILQEIVNVITSRLWHHEVWHRVCSVWWQQFAIVRGMSRWHAIESKEDHHWLLKLSKYIADHLEIVPIQEIDHLRPLIKEDYKTKPELNQEMIKVHLVDWVKKEESLLQILSEGINKLYELREYPLVYELNPLVKEIECERFCVMKLHDRLNATNFDMADVGIVMKDLHSYFEKDYDKYSGKVDFDI